MGGTHHEIDCFRAPREHWINVAFAVGHDDDLSCHRCEAFGSKLRRFESTAALLVIVWYAVMIGRWLLGACPNACARDPQQRAVISIDGNDRMYKKSLDAWVSCRSKPGRRLTVVRKGDLARVLRCGHAAACARDGRARDMRCKQSRRIDLV